MGPYVQEEVCIAKIRRTKRCLLHDLHISPYRLCNSFFFLFIITESTLIFSSKFAICARKIKGVICDSSVMDHFPKAPALLRKRGDDAGESTRTSGLRPICAHTHAPPEAPCTRPRFLADEAHLRRPMRLPARLRRPPASPRPPAPPTPASPPTCADGLGAGEESDGLAEPPGERWTPQFLSQPP